MTARAVIYDPLHNPAIDTGMWVPPVDTARRVARTLLDKQASANIHVPEEMLNAAIGLEIALRDLLNALDAEEGRTP